MSTVRLSRPEDGERIVEIWRRAVAATHDFVAPDDLADIDAAVRDVLPQTPLWLAVDADDRPLAFMGLTGAHMDSLFVDPACHGQGIGRDLVEYAQSAHLVLTVEVNEQNSGARRFYERLGFVAVGRSEKDDQGRPYPLLRMRRTAAAPIIELPKA